MPPCGEKPENMYGYSPLQGHRHIRLLRLLPDWDENAPLRSKLFEYPMLELEDGPHMYEALSYVWGSPEKPYTLYIDEKPMSITANLHEVLLRLRNKMIERIIWVDAVCIDQSNIEERGQQIQYMAEIYSKASRVIVWLGEAANQSDRALTQIRMAADEEQQKSAVTDEDRLNILAILGRPWFRRIWVLQEVAAAQHIVMMCGSTRIDGYAFCLGLPSMLSYDCIPSHVRSVTYLMRGSIFRPKYSTNLSGGISLDIRPLGGLIDMYHAHEATERHDKIFALLGMSSDNPSASGLIPNYKIPWDELMAKLVKFILGESVLVWPWTNQQAATVLAKGCVVGIVSSVQTAKDDSRGDRQHVSIKIQDTLEITWIISVAVQPIEVGDIVCHLHGTANPMVARPSGDHFLVIMIEVTPPNNTETEMMKERLGPPGSSSVHDFLLVWDWNYHDEEVHRRDYEAWTVSQLSQDKDAGSEGYINKQTRLWNMALITSDAGSNDESVVDMLQEMKKSCVPDLGQVDRRGLMCMSKLALSYGRMGRLWEAEVEFWRMFWAMRDTRQSHFDLIRELDAFGAMCRSRGHVVKATNTEKIADLLEIARRYPILEEGDFAVVLADASIRDLELTENLVKKAEKRFRSAMDVDETPHRRRYAASSLEALLARAVRKGNMEATYLVLCHDKAQINDEVLMNAVRSEDSSALWCILGREKDEVLISEDIVVRAAKRSNESVLQYLLERHEDKIHITEDVVVAAVDNQERSVLVYLLGKWKHKFRITEQVAIAAAENEEFPALKILLREKGEEIEPTMQLVMAAASNREKSVLHNLLQEKGSEIDMTEDQIMAAWKKQSLVAGKRWKDVSIERIRNIHLRRHWEETR